ncbi:hypothetical protein COLO4_35993 [Corchorus olitorius]|uniref:Uncharacterized protein n=1 Tax=Corchorus olitorius TaxID=93759 RepID=A0A1R3GBG4_9ROSI|nr:hypothetical protein COLO4_35993 [Corchorus olitorius]
MKFEIVLEALKNRHPPGDIRARFLLFQGARLGFSDGDGAFAELDGLYCPEKILLSLSSLFLSSASFVFFTLGRGCRAGGLALAYS